MRTDDPDMFMWQGFEYYLAGRFAFIQRSRIAANLFHHSVELLLKYDLLRDVAKGAWPNYRHDLARLWKAFKNSDGSRSALARFDTVVSDLDDWENIRYPGFRTSETSGTAVAQTMAFLPQRTPVESDSGGMETDEYVLCLEDVDELLSAIVTAASINPAALFVHLSPEAREWYVRDNRHVLAKAL